MTLNPIPSFPSQRSYVLRLDAEGPPGTLSGRLEHINSGDGVEFHSAEDLLRALREHAGKPEAAAGPGA